MRPKAHSKSMQTTTVKPKDPGQKCLDSLDAAIDGYDAWCAANGVALTERVGHDEAAK